MNILKTVVTVTVLHDADDPLKIRDCTLEDIGHEISYGEWLGSVDYGVTTRIPWEQVAEECRKLGNDGTFFDKINTPNLHEEKDNANHHPAS